MLHPLLDFIVYGRVTAATHGVHELDFGMRNGAVTFGYNTATDKGQDRSSM